MKRWSDEFEFKTRVNGVDFCHCKDDSPSILADFIKDVHSHLSAGMWANDWIYEKIYDAFCSLELCEDDSNYERIACEIEPDVWTHDLVEWARDSFAQEYIDEELEDGERPRNFSALLSMAQQRAIEHIYSYVWMFVKEQRDEA